jgi:hypothetical protein
VKDNTLLYLVTDQAVSIDSFESSRVVADDSVAPVNPDTSQAPDTDKESD